MPSRRSLTLAALLVPLVLSIVLMAAAQPVDSIPGLDAARVSFASAKQDRPEQAAATSVPSWTLGWVIPYPDQHIGYQGWMTNLRAARDGSVWTVDNDPVRRQSNDDWRPAGCSAITCRCSCARPTGLSMNATNDGSSSKVLLRSSQLCKVVRDAPRSRAKARWLIPHRARSRSKSYTSCVDSRRSQTV